MSDIYKKLLIESTGLIEASFRSQGYQEFNRDVQDLFPVIFNTIKGNIQLFVPVFMNRMKQEEKVQNERIKNLNLEIRINSMAARNAYTYPAISDTTSATLLNTLVAPFAPVIMVLNGFKFLSENSQTMEEVENKGGLVVFPSKLNKMKVLTFETKGLLQALREEERTAILLHEIGHWARIDPFVKMLSFSMLALIPPITIFCLIGIVAMSRSKEWEADAFAKKCGYGEQLANALENISVNRRQDVNFFLKIGDMFLKIMAHINNVIDHILPIHAYPSIAKRVKALREAEINDGYKIQEGDFTLEEILFIREEILQEGFIKDKLYSLIRPICHKFDQKVGRDVKKLFPIK